MIYWLLDQNAEHTYSQQDVLLHLEIFNHLKDAVSDVDFIQENAPERLDVKQQLYQEITAYCPEHTIIASKFIGLKSV